MIHKRKFLLWIFFAFIFGQIINLLQIKFFCRSCRSTVVDWIYERLICRSFVVVCRSTVVDWIYERYDKYGIGSVNVVRV